MKFLFIALCLLSLTACKKVGTIEIHKVLPLVTVDGQSAGINPGVGSIAMELVDRNKKLSIEFGTSSGTMRILVNLGDNSLKKGGEIVIPYLVSGQPFDLHIQYNKSSKDSSSEGVVTCSGTGGVLDDKPARDCYRTSTSTLYTKGFSGAMFDVETGEVLAEFSAESGFTVTSAHEQTVTERCHRVSDTEVVCTDVNP